MGDVPSSERLASQTDSHTMDNNGIIPQLLAALPAINDASSCFAKTASYMGRQFANFVEDVVATNVSSSQTETVVSPFEGHLDSASYFGERCGESTISTKESSTSASVNETTSISTSTVASTINPSSMLVEATQSFWNTPTFFQGLMFPVTGFRYAWRVAFACLRYSFICVRHTHTRVKRLVSRVQTTLRGSADDIGWLLRTPGMASVEDGTDRFRELLEKIRNGEHSLPDTLVYLLIPGLFSNHGPLYFVDTKKFFSKLGLACHIAKIHSEASVETNARELKQYIEELYWGSGKRVMLLGHSKGGVDAAAALAMYWPDLKDKVAGLALVQSPYGGSPIASDILREGQIADTETRHIMELLICKVIKGDIRALEDLTYERRREFISEHPLPTDLPLVSFHTEVSIAPGVLATMSHIAHAELPWLPLTSTSSNSEEATSQGTKLPVVMPLAAAMAACALHLQLRYGEKSDGLVARKDAEVPGSVVVRPDRKLDHAWMVYSSSKTVSMEPDASQMCEALLTLLVEIGQRNARTSEIVSVK